MMMMLSQLMIMSSTLTSDEAESVRRRAHARIEFRLVEGVPHSFPQVGARRDCRCVVELRGDGAKPERPVSVKRDQKMDLLRRKRGLLALHTWAEGGWGCWGNHGAPGGSLYCSRLRRTRIPRTSTVWAGSHRLEPLPSPALQERRRRLRADAAALSCRGL